MSSSPSKDRLEVSSAMLDRVFPEVEIPQIETSDGKDVPAYVSKWKAILRDRLMAACADALDAARPLVKALEKNDAAPGLAAEAFDLEQRRTYQHEQAMPRLQTDGRKIAASRRQSWEDDFARWEQERASLLDSLIRKHDAVFAARERKNVQPDDVMDVSVLAQAKNQLLGRISQIRLMLQETESAVRTHGKDDALRGALMELAGEDELLLEVATPPEEAKAVEPTPHVQPYAASAHPKKPSAKAPAKKNVRQKAPITVTTTPRQVVRAHPYQGQIHLHFPKDTGEISTHRIQADDATLHNVDVPSETQVRMMIHDARVEMSATKSAMDAKDLKDYPTAISSAMQTFREINAQTVKLDGSEKRRKVLALLASKMPAFSDHPNMNCKTNALKQFLLYALEPALDEGGIVRSVAEERLPLIGDLNMGISFTGQYPVTKEQAFGYRDYFAVKANTHLEGERFHKSMTSAFALFQPKDRSEYEADYIRRCRLYIGEADQLANGLIERIQGDPLVILPTMRMFLPGFYTNMHNGTNLVCRMQQERMINKIAEHCLRHLNALQGMGNSQFIVGQEGTREVE